MLSEQKHHRIFWTTLFGDRSLAGTIQQLAPLIVLLVSILTFAGWVFGTQYMLRAPYQLSTLHPLTCLGLIFLGFSLRLGRQEKLNRTLARFSVFMSLGVAAMGLMSITGNQGDLSQKILTAICSIEGVRFLPSQASGLGLMLLGLISFLRQLRRSIVARQALLCLVSLLCLAPLLEAIYGASVSSSPPNTIGWPRSSLLMEIPVAILILLATLTLFIRLANRGALATLDANSASRTLAWRLLPASILVPIALGWMRLIAETWGWIPKQFGLLIHVLASIAVMLAIVWASVRALAHKTAFLEEIQHSSLDLEASYRELLNICDRPVFAYNSKGEITYLNPVARLVFGVAPPNDKDLYVHTLVGQEAWRQHFAPMLLGVHGSDKIQKVAVHNRCLITFWIDLQIVYLYRYKSNVEILVFVTQSVEMLLPAERFISKDPLVRRPSIPVPLQPEISNASFQSGIL